MTKIEREYLTLLIANDFAELQLHEIGQREQFEALMTELEHETKRWVAELQRISRTNMTEPHQRTRALLKARRFLEELTSPGDTPHVPPGVRDTARQLLLHYPGFEEIEAAHKALPDLYASVYPPGLLDNPLQPYARGKT